MRTSLLAICLLITVPAIAQHSNHAHSQNEQTSMHPPAGQPQYAGLQTRTIKALSEQQISDIREGKGMSLALAAELNGYPGPSHVIDMAKALGLSEDQLSRTKRLYKDMQTEAKAVGEQSIASEVELDRLFKDKKTVTLSAVQDATARAAKLQGQLRFAHLKYHLSMVEILTPSQVATYNELRGYQ